MIRKADLAKHIISWNCNYFWVCGWVSGISIGNSMVCSDIWHKYHEWYFKIVLHNFAVRRVKFEAIWNITSGIYAKYHVQFMLWLLIVYTTTWEIQSCVYFLAMCLFLSSCFASQASKLVLKFLFSAQLV